MLQEHFVKGVAFINVRKQDKHCLIMSRYSILFSVVHSISRFPSVHLRTELLTESCFAVIPLLIVDLTGRIRLPSVIPLCHWLCSALSCCSPCESPALLTASPQALQILLTCAQTHSGPHVHRALLAVRWTA